MNRAVVDPVARAIGERDCVVALGGGADSAVLLAAAVEAVGRERVAAVFVYHGLEGSDELKGAAERVAESCGVACTVLDGIVDDGGNLEARARTARYEAIEAAIPPESVVLAGHTADDQAETVLMRLLRGSGAGGLSGIPDRRGQWRRPFLAQERASLRAIARDLDLDFVDDPANTDRRFMRSRMRHEVMPVIEAEFGAESRRRIIRSSELLADDERVLAREADAVGIIRASGAVSIPTGPIVTSSRPIASRIVRRALRTLLDEYPGSASDIDAVLAVAAGGDPVTISNGYLVNHEPPFVTIHSRNEDPVRDGFEISVGESFEWCGTEYSTFRASRPPPSVNGRRFTILDAEAVGDRIGLRGFSPGDKLETGNGSSPAKELLRTAGIPARLRPRSLMVTVDASIAAVAGVRVASWAKAHHDRSAVVIEREVGTWT